MLKRTDEAGLTTGATPIRAPMLATLMIASALSPLAINIFIPSVTSIAGDFDVPPSTIGLGLSLYLAATAAIQLLAGPLSDRYGRRPVMIVGSVLFLVGTLMCIVAGSATVFLVGRIIQAASATGIALSRAIVRDVFDRARSASMIGYVTMGFAVAPMLGPAIGGHMDGAFGWRSVFWLLLVLGVLTLGLLVFDLSETNRDKGKPVFAQAASYGILAGSPAFWRYVGVSALTSAVFFSFLGGGPIIAGHVLDMTPAGYGMWFMLCAFGYIVGNFVAGRYSQRFGLKPMMVAGSLLSFSAPLLTLGLFLAGLVTPATLFAPMFVVGIGNGLALPSSTAGGVSVRPEAAGAAAGLLGAFQIGAGAACSTIAAHLAERSDGPVAVALLMAACGFLGLMCAVTARREAALAP